MNFRILAEQGVKKPWFFLTLFNLRNPADSAGLVGCAK